MKKKSIISIASAGLMICTLGIKDAYADTSEGTINASTLNIRSGPSTSHGVVTKAKRGSKVTILSSSEGWHQVRLSNNQEGWASGQYVSIGGNGSSTTQPAPEETNPSDTSNSGKTGTVNTSSLNVRSGPSTNYGVVSKVKRGNNVTIVGSQNGWHKVKLSNGTQGWVSGQYINIGGSNVGSSNPSTTSKKMNVVATAYTGYSTTSTGQKPVWGTIAVDPKVIPYGTRVYIPHFDQVFVANNTGGAIKGNKIDIFMNSKKECYNWGRKNIEIQILD